MTSAAQDTTAPLTAAQGQAGDALTGLRVLDFTSMIAGPYAARLLADLGAEVIKIEPPGGEDMRQRAPLQNGHSRYFGQLNAGKQSITLDLKNAGAIKLAVRMVEKADVVIENFRPGVMQRLGLDYAALSRINSRLVYCSISGYGQTGAAIGRPAYAPVVHAASGFDKTLARYAGASDRPASGAVFIADVLGGIYAASAIQTALLQRVRTGIGQQVDVALMDCMLNLLVYELQEAQVPPMPPRFSYGPIRAADGDLLIAPITQRNFTMLCDAIGQPELKTDARFATVAARSRNWYALMACAEAWAGSRTVGECIALLDAGGVPCSHYAEAADVLTNADLIARGTFANISDGGGTYKGINPPYQLSGTRACMRAQVPSAGEQGDAILRTWLGLSDEELAQAKASGLLGTAP